MKSLLLFVLIFLLGGLAIAQDTGNVRSNRKITGGDTSHVRRVTQRNAMNLGVRKLEYFRDTIKRERRKFDSTLFTNIVIPSTGDYAQELGKVYLLLSNVAGETTSFVKLRDIHAYMDKGDSALDVLKARMFQSERNFNVRNLQMFNTLLDALDKNTRDYTGYLDLYDSTMDDVREQIADMQKDTLMIHIFRDTALKNAFQSQLQQLKFKWKEVDSLVTEKGKEINTLRSQISAHTITIGELLNRVDAELRAVGSDAFGKERRFLWETAGMDTVYSEENFKETFDGELQLTRLYFANTRNNRTWLVLFGFVFFFWIWWNFRTLRRLGKMNSTEKFSFNYISSYPAGGSVIFILCVAPLFDLHAPAIYIESVQLLLMLFVTIIFRKRQSREFFYGWCIFIFLFLLLLSSRIVGMSLDWQRWINFFVVSLALVFGVSFIVRHGKKVGKWVYFAVGLYVFFNLLAVICNLLGRVTLSHIFSYTAVYSLAQTASLGVFVKLVQESFLLQIHTSRIKKKYPEGFDYTTISRSILRFSIALAGLLWLIVLTTNLNLFDTLYDLLVDIFNSTRKIGNFNFTIGGILLFMGIIWLANFLQKYIAYFFGDTGDDAAFDDKGQRSRLMVTRLILIIAGFLLAVAASGLAVDRITVILGALGVGIGLGLQGIVNNFVSGIILIFDRPLRIGDTVDIGDKRGRVKEIGIRASTLLTEEGAEVIIPNGDVLSHNIINWTISDNHVRQTLDFNIEKPADNAAIDPEAIKEIVKKNPNVTEQKSPEVLITTVNSKTLDVKIFFWCRDFNKSSLTSVEVRAAVYQYLEQKAMNVL